MTIDEAIEALTIFREQESALLGNEFAQAMALGIEALKAWREHRRIMGHPKLWILPGETKE